MTAFWARVARTAPSMRPVVWGLGFTAHAMPNLQKLGLPLVSMESKEWKNGSYLILGGYIMYRDYYQGQFLHTLLTKGK